MNERRVYKPSSFGLFFIVPIFGFFLAGSLVLTFISKWYGLPLLISSAVAFYSLVSIFTTNTIMSQDEISVKTLLGTKILLWSEITRVSGSGYSIHLHNFNDDIIVSPSAQLPQYDEVVEFIGQKRPDLFDPREHEEMSTSWVSILTMPILGALILGAGIFIYSETDSFIPLFIFSVIGLGFIGVTLAAVQSISIKGNSLIIGYLFTEKTLGADQIEDVIFGFTRDKYGRPTASFHVDLRLEQGDFIRIGNMRPGLPIVYHVLKNWHQKRAGIRQTNQ